MNLSDITKIKSEPVYRSIGGINSRERIGAGFMNKSGVSDDNVNFVYPYYVVVYVLNGAGKYVDSSGQPYILKPGSFFQRIPGQRHSNYIDPDSDWVECFVDLGQSMLMALESMRIVHSHQPVGAIGLDLDLAERFRQLKEKLKICEEDELPEQLLSALDIIITIFKRSRNENKIESDAVMLETFCQYLGREPDKHLDLKGFCRKKGWGYEKLRKLFRSKIGVSPGQYRIRRRLDISCQLLNDPHYSIGEIASKLGYSSQYEFSAQFKRHLGVSPLHYRLGN